MKYPVVFKAIVATVVFVASSVTAKAMSCSSDDMSRMTTMISGMADGLHKLKMYKHLEMLNTTMSKDGMRGCDMMMRKMMRSSKMRMMKSGM